MDWRARLAKALTETVGGVHVYHGSTERNLKTFDPRQAVETRGAVFHATNPDVAETFTFPREYGESMLYDPRTGRELKRGRVYESILTPKNLLEVPPNIGQRFIEDSPFQQQFINDAIRQGHDAVVARNVREGIGEQFPGDVYAQLAPGIAKIFGKWGLVPGAVMGGVAAQDQYGAQQ